MKCIIKNIGELEKISKEILQGYSDTKKTLFLGLVGELGSGKTTFTQYLAKTLKIKENITSPTFIIHREYKIPSFNRYPWEHLHHIDLYRLQKQVELEEIKIQNLLINPNIIVVEWADRFEKYLKNIVNSTNSKSKWIYFEHVNETCRKIWII